MESDMGHPIAHNIRFWRLWQEHHNRQTQEENTSLSALT